MTGAGGGRSAPPARRAVAFVDGQNPFHAAREALAALVNELIAILLAASVDKCCNLRA